MAIPKQLQNDEFRFVKLRPKSKIPFELNWQKKGYTWKEIQQWIEAGNNYGIIGGYGKLRILDTDNPEFAKKMKEILPSTFTVKTGNGGMHFYFISGYSQNHVLKDNLGELRSSNYQVVGVSSIHPNGNEYTIENDCPIATIDLNEFKRIINPFLRNIYDKTSLDTISQKDTSRSGKEFYEVLKKIKEGKSKEVIYNEMMLYSKWFNAPPQYRDLTYTKALKITDGENYPEEEIKELLFDVYNKIETVLRNYCDLREDYYSIISLWIIGTYVHKSFYSYPYLFINAMKGSGKSRLLKLISILSYNGKYLNNINEAVMFRTAHKSTFCIDEFEGIGGKDKSSLRELLNGAYKNGMVVERAVKVKSKTKEDYEIESHPIFCPIAMANIWGMDNVLGDRCLHLVLEKSSNSKIINKIEIFEYDSLIIDIKEAMSVFGVVLKLHLKGKNTLKTTLEDWNTFISGDLTTLTTYNTYNTYNTLTTPKQQIRHYVFFEKIIEKKVEGRYLELYFPLYILAYKIDPPLFLKILEISQKFVQERKAEDLIENRDISFLDFLYQGDLKQKYGSKNFIEVKIIANSFKEFLKEEDEEVKWINVRAIGRALARLNLIESKRRLRNGVEVTINFDKALEKLKIFREIEVEKKPSIEFTECRNCKGKSPPFVLNEKGICNLCSTNNVEEEVKNE